MIKKKFVSLELKPEKTPVFINGDDSSADKNLVDIRVSNAALRAVFRERPSYFLPKNKISG